jgi:acylphosphatase
MLTARRFVVSGRVQGVGFRAFALDVARAEGLTGWVMNRPDGRVEAHAEGEAAAVERFERRLRRGPPGARIEEVEAFDAAPASHASDFIVRRFTDPIGS